MNREIKMLKEKLKGLKVLYVEDEEEMRRGTELFLNKFFSFVEIGKNGAEGLEKLKKNSFDIVFTDIMMPKVTGLEMLEKTQRDDNFFCIALTASDVRENEMKSLIDLYFRKPITYENMSLIMRAIVRKFDL